MKLRGESKEQRSELQIDRLSGQLLQWTQVAQVSRGQRWRTYARFLHTGEVFGLPGQIVALIAALSALLLVWTGFALAIRRFFRMALPDASRIHAQCKCSPKRDLIGRL